MVDRRTFIGAVTAAITAPLAWLKPESASDARWRPDVNPQSPFEPAHGLKVGLTRTRRGWVFRVVNSEGYFRTDPLPARFYDTVEVDWFWVAKPIDGSEAYGEARLRPAADTWADGTSRSYPWRKFPMKRYDG